MTNFFQRIVDKVLNKSEDNSKNLPVDEQAQIQNKLPYEVKGEGYTRVRVDDLPRGVNLDTKREVMNRVKNVREEYKRQYGSDFSESENSMYHETMAHKRAYDLGIAKNHTDISDMNVNDWTNKLGIFDKFPEPKL